jgi:hypothetical protein
VRSTCVYEIHSSTSAPCINDCHVERKIIYITSTRGNIVFSQTLLGHAHSGNKCISKSLVGCVQDGEYETVLQTTSYISRATLPRRLTDLTHSAHSTRHAVNWMGAIDVKNNGNENSVGQNWVAFLKTSLNREKKYTFSNDSIRAFVRNSSIMTGWRQGYHLQLIKLKDFWY